MGFTPAEVNAMSMFEFLACTEGYAEAHGGKKKQRLGSMDDDDLRAMGIEGF